MEKLEPAGDDEFTSPLEKMAAASGRREHPIACGRGDSHLEYRGDALRHGDAPTRVVCLAVLDLDTAVAHALPFQSEAFLRAQAAVDQDRRHVVQQGRSVFQITLLLVPPEDAFRRRSP